MSELFASRLEAFLEDRLGAGQGKVVSAERVFGGGSKETWSARIEMPAEDGSGRVTRDIVIRMDPEKSFLETKGHIEVALYRAFFDVPGVPVPEILWVEDDPSVLGGAFFVMAKLPGSADPMTLLAPQYDEARPHIAEEMMEILARISTADPAALDLGDAFPLIPPEDAWRVQLDHWEQVLRDHPVGPLPITEAAIRHLRRRPPPPPPRLSVVHGDFRVGNFLYTERIEGILDWEMGHLGDPHEDLAWTIAPNWRWGDPALAGGVLDPERALAIWEAGSGLRVDPEALHWWSVFLHVKAMAIWITGVCSGAPRYAGILWFLLDKEDQWTLEAMEVLA